MYVPKELHGLVQIVPEPRNTLLTRFEAFTYRLKNMTNVVYPSM